MSDLGFRAYDESLKDLGAAHQKLQKGCYDLINSDYHMHTNYSTDSQSSMQEMVERAIKIGLSEIAFTDHQDYGPDYPDGIDYDKYEKNLKHMKKIYSSKINIVFGVEIGLAPHMANKIASFAKDHSFDFIIGSVHDVSGSSLYEGGFFRGKDKNTAFTGYFLELLEDIKLIDDFCVFGHLDYVNRYGGYRDNSLYYADYSDIIDEILKELIVRGKGIEINTSGYRYGLGRLHPQIDILKRYRELGGEIITIGSDAHYPRCIAENFNIAQEYLKEAGFRAYCHFRQRKPLFVDLSI